MNSILNNRNENKHYKKIYSQEIVERNNSIQNIDNIKNNVFKIDNNFTYKKEYYNNTISSNINNISHNIYNRSKYTIINKRHIEHTKISPVYNTDIQPTTNPLLKRPITIEDIIIKNNLQRKEYNNILIEKKINDINNIRNKAFYMNFSMLSSKKNCESC